MSYPVKYRERVVEYRQEGHTYAETKETFKVSIRTICKWEKQLKEERNLENKPLHRKYKKIDPEKLNHEKKGALHYQEKNTEKVKEYREKIAEIPKKSIAYVDESGIDTYLSWEYGYTPKGQEFIHKVRGRKFQRIGIVVAQIGREIVAPFEYSKTSIKYWFRGIIKGLLPFVKGVQTVAHAHHTNFPIMGRGVFD